MPSPGISFEDDIANAVISAFDLLPTKSKPVKQSSGLQTWVPLSGIVISRDNSAEVECVALGTGMRCLPATRITEDRNHVLHDWHAEVLAIRSFNYLLLKECLRLAGSSNHHSSILRWHCPNDDMASDEQPFLIREDVRIHMYSSQAPCGDASMELVMEAQDDATPWPVISADTDDQTTVMKGRGNFAELGIVRRKPARGDCPQTLSKSCSDKLALKQCTSLLNRFTCRLVDPRSAYLHDLVIPRSEYSEGACRRAFGPKGRMKPMVGKKWPGGYRYQPFATHVCHGEFLFSRRSVASSRCPPKGSNISAVWNKDLRETLVNGVLQGRKQTDPRGASSISQQSMALLASQTIEKLQTEKREHVILQADAYGAANREYVKDEVRSTALKGWIRNTKHSIITEYLKDAINLSQ